jgi:hypothetical protein
MSVGGYVVETRVCADRVFIATKERTYPKDEPVCIYVELTPEARAISDGDSVWWQGGTAFWTPANRAFEDRKLQRLSGSFRYSDSLTSKYPTASVPR